MATAAPDTTDLTAEQRTDYLLRLADTPVITAHRLSEMVGTMPVLEEEMALANTALDLIGQATMVYEHIASTDEAGRTADDIAFLRDAWDYRNIQLAELANGDFADYIVRQVITEAWALEQWTALTESSDAELAAIAERAIRETAYHLDHAGAWLIRLADGTDESRERIERAVTTAWRYVGELFEDDAVDEAAATAGLGVLPSSLLDAWQRRIDALFAQAGLAVPEDVIAQPSGRHGVHTEALGFILADMQFLQRAYPGLTW